MQSDDDGDLSSEGSLLHANAQVSNALLTASVPFALDIATLVVATASRM